VLPLIEELCDARAAAAALAALASTQPGLLPSELRWVLAEGGAGACGAPCDDGIVRPVVEALQPHLAPHAREDRLLCLPCAATRAAVARRYGAEVRAADAQALLALDPAHQAGMTTDPIRLASTAGERAARDAELRRLPARARGARSAGAAPGGSPQQALARRKLRHEMRARSPPPPAAAAAAARAPRSEGAGGEGRAGAAGAAGPGANGGAEVLRIEDTDAD